MRAIHIHMLGSVDHVRVTRDNGFEESKHPRADNGQFGAGGGGKKTESKELGGGLKAHPENKMREYTAKELDWEYGTEYLKYSKSEFPDAFSSREDFQKKYDAAPLVHLTDKELAGLGNSMAYSGKNKGEDWIHKTFSHRRDSKRIINEMKNEKTAPPIVLKRGGKLRLMAGQTRLATGLAFGMSVPAKVINVGGTKDEFNESKHPRGQPGNAGQFGPGGGGSNASTEHSAAVKKAQFTQKVQHATITTPTKGTTAERIALRKMLKEAGHGDFHEKALIKSKLLDSFKMQHDMVIKKGDHTKAAELMGKMQKLGYKPPPPSSVAAANQGYTPKQVEQAKEVMKSVLPQQKTGGFSPQDTSDFNDLVEHVGSSSAKHYSQIAKNKLGSNPHKLSVGEAACIVAYSASAYEHTNEALRAGVMNEATWKHVNKLNAALDKLPAYTGPVTRGTTLQPEMLKLYKPDMIVEERGFTSSAYQGEGFSGNTKFHITSRNGKKIKSLSTHASENEVLFKSGTRFKVTKVITGPDYGYNKPHQIHMIEV